MTTPEDGAIRERIAALYDTYAARLRLYVRGLVGTPELAEDVVQDTFVAVAGQLAAGRTITHMPTYLYTTARHAAFGATRRLGRGRRARAALLEDPTLFAHAGSPGNPLNSLDISVALARLPNPQREVVLLKIWGGLTFAEIAAVTGTSGNTVASRYRYALNRLRTTLEEGTA